MNKLREAVRHILMTKRSNRQIGLTVGLSHTTIAKYRKILSKHHFDWPTVEEMNDYKIEKIFRATRTFERLKRLPDWSYIGNHP